MAQEQACAYGFTKHFLSAAVIEQVESGKVIPSTFYRTHHLEILQDLTYRKQHAILQHNTITTCTTRQKCT